MIFHEPKTLHSMTMISKWLDAIGIYNEINNDNTVTVQDPNGNPVDVMFSLDPIAGERTAKWTVLDSKSITGKDINKAKSIFKDLVESLGYTYTDPTGRPDPTETKLYAKNDFENVYLRHRDLERSPNPDTDRLLFYKKVIDNVSKSVYNKDIRFFLLNQVDLEDLRSIAMTHVVSYIANYELPEHMDRQNNNLRKCHSFLIQRLYFYKSMLREKAKSCFDVAFKPTEALSVAEVIEEEIDEDYVNRHNVFSSRDKGVRRKEAKKMLFDSLEALGHDDMIDTLTLASKSHYIHIDAQKLATKILNEHILGCHECSSHPSKEASPVYVGS